MLRIYPLIPTFLQSDGNMVLYSSKGNVLWDSKTNGNTGGYTLRVQNDGNMVFYSGGKAKWNSNTAGSCTGEFN